MHILLVSVVTTMYGLDRNCDGNVIEYSNNYIAPDCGVILPPRVSERNTSNSAFGQTLYRVRLSRHQFHIDDKCLYEKRYRIGERYRQYYQLDVGDFKLEPCSSATLTITEEMYIYCDDNSPYHSYTLWEGCGTVPAFQVKSRTTEVTVTLRILHPDSWSTAPLVRYEIRAQIRNYTNYVRCKGKGVSIILSACLYRGIILFCMVYRYIAGLTH